MSTEKGELRFKGGDTAEDFANLVAEALEDKEGVVRVAFEDFTLPDSVVFQVSTEVGGQEITYAQLFSGALDYFHGLKPSSMRAVPNSDALPMTPYSMSLEMSFDAEGNVTEPSEL